ncbi:MAG: phosphotransferase family protein [Actinobacteria bacterium]|nr:phosphotransferase family protein [Actinomycetota bacterium]
MTGGGAGDTADEARAVRDEDAFDVAALDDWLRGVLAAQGQELADGAGPEVRQFPGGASNLTFLVRYRADGPPDADGDDYRDLVVRMPPRGTKAASAHNMRREFEIQLRLRPQFPTVPLVLAYSPADGSPIGSEFYVMERARGIILRADLPPSVADDPKAAILGDELFDLLADLHSVDVEAAGLEEFYRGPGYVERQVSGWSGRYRAARTDDAPAGDAIMGWLADNQPADVGARLIHGDWRFDNLVLDSNSLAPVAVLDWELATVGDPLMDLGAALAYWVQPDDDDFFQGFRRQPSNAPGMPTRAQIVARYLERTGYPCDDWRFYEVFGLFRLAVIAQQIWYRYSRGETSNPAFRQFGPAVDYLMWRCADRIGSPTSPRR